MTTKTENIDRLRAENEQLRMQLVACGVVAMANTPETAKLQREMHPDYMSESCRDVMRAVDREMALRARLGEIEGQEPVAYAVFAENGNIRIWCPDPIQAETLRQQYGDQPKPLYSAPAPAIPEETLSPYEILGWCHAYFCCSLDAGEDPRTTEVGDIIEKMNRQLLAAAPKPAEQHPNVTQLVEALERARTYIDDCGAQAGAQSAIDDIDAALAAHRKQGGSND